MEGRLAGVVGGVGIEPEVVVERVVLVEDDDEVLDRRPRRVVVRGPGGGPHSDRCRCRGRCHREAHLGQYHTIRPRQDPELPAQFTPLRRATRRMVAILFLLGPVLWVAGLVVVAVVVRRSDVIGLALIVLAVSFLLGAISLLAMRTRSG